MARNGTTGSATLKVAFLVGDDNLSTRRSIEAVCSAPGIRPVAVLLDTEGTPPFKRRLKNLRRNIRDNGISYPLFRIVEAIRNVTDALVQNAVVCRSEVMDVLRTAFPDISFSLDELGAKNRMPVHRVGNLNHPAAIRVLAACDADLGIVLGTRILKPTTFSVPRLGCLNLHKGKVPEYRGMPPGFWELYDGASSAGVTVHFVDKGLDTGDVIATGSVPIVKTDTPDSLREKLHQEGARQLAIAVSAIRDRNATRQPQESYPGKPRTRPTRNEVASLKRRLPHWREDADLPAAARNLYLLFIYYSGIYSLCRTYRKLRRRSRGAIYLYHRVNDYSKDVLTVDPETFAAQLLAISKRHPICSTREIVDRVRNKRKIDPTAVAIHFDDCYRDIATDGAPILKALGIPACAFISTGYLDTNRRFPHDEAKYPFLYPMLRSSDVRSWVSDGLEVGAHTVNHVDLGARQDWDSEILPCGETLRKITGKPVEYFSFPFGRAANISETVRSAIAEAGYRALFSADGGFIGEGTDLYDIPRMGSSYRCSPLYCLIQIEGLALSQIVSAVANIRRPAKGKATSR